MTVLTNATLASVAGSDGYGLLETAALRVEAGQITWIGGSNECCSLDGETVIDCEGRLVTPGLIDCHTHLVHGGDRADEFEARLNGASYAEIALSGGGIQSTVKQTRQTGEAQLFEQARSRLQAMLDEGLTTVEIKSGYGLDTETEMKMLRVARQLGASLDVSVCTTFLAAHALPDEFRDRGDDYIDLVINEMLPQAHSAGLVDMVDVFIENIAFTVAQGKRVLEAARQLGLPIKAHAEQLSHTGAAAMAAEMGALSVDHLEYLDQIGLARMADNGTTAVLLPGAFYTLGETRLPPVDLLRKRAVPMAVATDANPGSSPIHSLLLVMNMACTLFGLTAAEALRGVTINAAKALGLSRQLGSLEIGKQADLVIWDVDRPSKLSYRVGINSCVGVMRAGQWRLAPEF